MFNLEEISEVLTSQQFIADYNWVQQSLVNSTVKHKILFEDEIYDRLDYFVECVFASCTDWEGGTKICRIAAEISEILSSINDIGGLNQKRNRIRSAILYDYSGMPALSSSIIKEGDSSPFTIRFFKREGEFRQLFENGSLLGQNSISNGFSKNILDSVIELDALNLINFQQGYRGRPKIYYSQFLRTLSSHLNTLLNSSEANVLSRVFEKRLDASTKNNVSEELFSVLKKINFPVELWPAQLTALDDGLLDTQYNSWGLAAPTGTGKTFLTRLLITDALRKNPDSKILYIVPSRALVYEVATDLRNALDNLDIEVLMINPLLSDLDEMEEESLENASVVVLTPEKADLLTRIGKSNLDEVSNVIIDEAHHIESDTRGVLLELYLWRLKQLISRPFRFIFLSAVAPNINELTSWAGDAAKSSIFHDRPTRMRAGVFRIRKIGSRKQGWIDFADETSICLLNERLETSSRRLLVQVAQEIHKKGPVLVVAKGKKECENLAKALLDRQLKSENVKRLTKEELSTEYFQRVDSRLEREMYSSVPLRELIKNRIAYHHAGLPPRVRYVLEDIIRKGLVDFVFATTTLAEGVNFPFSTVIVQSLAFRLPPQAGVSEALYKPITPRSFWNIAGRAGRPGFDKEGQVILFEPTLGIDKINAVLGSYLNPNLKDIEPVKSGLFNGINSLFQSYEKNNLDLDELNKIELGETISKEMKGTVNLLRVGLVHAAATGIFKSPEEIVDGSFANTFFSSEQIEFSKRLINQQSEILKDFFNSSGAPSERIVAEMGLSLDTISRLKQFVQRLEDWQIKSYQKLFYGGQVNARQVVYTIGPVAKNMAELEGTKLGGWVSDLAVNWLSGLPLTRVRPSSNYFRQNSIEDLISVIFSRIQYLLPWGLFATDNLLEEEANKRDINYNNEVKKLSYLVDSGVPNFDAFRLVNLDFERVDATRLSKEYYSSGGQELGVDIIGWLLNLEEERMHQILRGSDNRRIDYDLRTILDKMKNS